MSAENVSCSFNPVKPFQPSLLFVGKARGLSQSGAPERALPQNIGLCKKGLPGTNTLAYYTLVYYSCKFS